MLKLELHESMLLRPVNTLGHCNSANIVVIMYFFRKRDDLSWLLSISTRKNLLHLITAKPASGHAFPRNPKYMKGDVDASSAYYRTIH
jgi:hypothetical protein